MTPDDLIAAFNELDDAETRIDWTKVGDAETIRLVPSWNKAAVRRFKALAVDGAALFDPAGQGDPETRWLRIVLHNAPELAEDRHAGPAIEHHDGTERRVSFIAQTLPNAASASALVVRRLSGVARTFEQVGTPDDLARVIDRLDLDLPQRIASVYGGPPDDGALRDWATQARTAYARLRRSDPSLPPLPHAQRGYREDLEAIRDRVVGVANGCPTPPVDPKASMKGTKPRRPPRSDADKLRDEGEVAAHLIDHPDATRDQVSEATGIAPAHVSASKAWKAHKAQRREAQNANRARGIGGVDGE